MAWNYYSIGTRMPNAGALNNGRWFGFVAPEGGGENYYFQEFALPEYVHSSPDLVGAAVTFELRDQESGSVAADRLRLQS